MKRIGRTIKTKYGWFLWCKGNSYPIDGDLSMLIHGGLVFIEKNIRNSIDAKYLRLYARPRRAFMMPEDSWRPKQMFKNRLAFLRSPKGIQLINSRSSALQSIRQNFLNDGFIEVTTPSFIARISEGNVPRFEINFDNQSLYLAMTFIPYLNLLVYSGNDRVFQVGNVFQSGKTNSPNQVNEYLAIDRVYFVLKRDLEKEISSINSILSKCTDLLKKVNSLKQINLIKKKIPTLSYYNLVKEFGAEIPLDQKHLSSSSLEMVQSKYGNVFWIIDFPKNFKPFYCATRHVDGRDVVLSAELWWKGFKIATASVTENDPEKQRERIKYLGLNLRDFNFYFDFMDDGAPPTIVSTINFDRFIAKMFSCKTVKEAILFPRATRHAVVEP